MLTRTLKAAAIAAGAAALVAAGPALAFPDKPVRVIVPYGAGGSTDIVVRTIVEKVNEIGGLGQPLVVVNVTGAGGPVGFTRAKDAEPDGHEILATHIGLIVSKAVGTTPFGAEAFEPIAQTGSVRFVSAVAADSPYGSFEEFVAAAKEKPGTVPEANSIGGAIHLASLGLADGAGYETRIVQVGGGAERIKSILGHITEHTLFTVSEYGNFKDSGVKALAFLGPERHPDLPDVPSTAELGAGEGISVDTWWFAPKGTPQDRVDALAEALGAAMADEDLAANLEAKGISPNFLAGDELAARIDERAAQADGFADKLQGK